MGTKHKHKALRTMVWKVVQLNGPLQPFLDFLWGGATCDFMVWLEQVPPNAMARIIEEAKLVAVCHRTRMLNLKSTVQSEHAALAFC
jgi:hypothetical protein